MNEFNQKLDIFLRDKRGNPANPRMEKRDQWIARLFQVDRERSEVKDEYNVRKRNEVMRIRTEVWLMRKRSKSHGRFKFVAALKEVYTVVEEVIASFGHGGEK